MCEGKTSLKTTGDGNCLFNSISILLTGEETLSVELRLRTCLELAFNINFYATHAIFQQQIKTKNGKAFYKAEDLFDTVAFGKTSSKAIDKEGFHKALEIEIMQTSYDGKFSGILQVAALSSVIGCPINMVYPNQNFHLLTMFQGLISPRNECCPKQITLMWSCTNGCLELEKFTANHFVPLIYKPKTNYPVSDVLVDQTKTIVNYYPRKRKAPEVSEDELPFEMDKEWYIKVGRNDLSNIKRTESRNSGNCKLPLTLFGNF